MTEISPSKPAQPALSLSFAEVGRLRVRPAEFARMVGVSRQTVSQWVATGKVTLGADGKLDPNVASQQVVRNSDPTRLRARVLREAVEDAATLRRRIANLETELATAQARIAFLDRFSDNQERAEEILVDMILQCRAELDACADAAARRALLEEWRDRAAILVDGLDPDALPAFDDAGLPVLTPTPAGEAGEIDLGDLDAQGPET